MPRKELSELATQIGGLRRARILGRVERVDGTLVEATGLGEEVSVGDRVRLMGRSAQLDGLVLRLEAGRAVLMPEGSCEGIARGDRVVALGPPSIAPSDGWIGRVLSPGGNPLDGGAPPSQGTPRPYRSPPVSAAARRGLGARLASGLAIFDTLLPIVAGQRIGIFAGSGVGKSRLIAQLAQRLDADVVVIALIGERGRELRDFVESTLGPEGMARSVVIAATSDRPAIERRRCAMAAMSVAEFFRDQGARVLLLADSITRFAEAHREIALAAGELPALRGYPPSTAQEIMALVERAGPGGNGQGDITAVFTVLVAGSDMEEPVADILRGTLDGHIVLEREIAERGRFPAVNVLRSVSRSLPEAASEIENGFIADARGLLGAYAKAETMIRAGLYREGDPITDRAVRAWPELDAFVSENGGKRPEDSFARLADILRRAGDARASDHREKRRLA